MMISKTLYGKYLEERGGGKLIEDDMGFVTYRIEGKECFLMEIFADPHNRKIGIARDLVNRLSEAARAAGCTIITANIYLNDPCANNTLISALLIGFKLVSANGNTLLIALNLSGELENG